MFQMGENIVIDESIASFKGRVKYKKYCCDKKNKWGMKSGYCLTVKQATYTTSKCIQARPCKLKACI